MNLDDLKKPFDPRLISWRVGATSGDKKSGIALAYLDARDVMERLDEVCGVGGWQCTHPHANGKTSCRIGIKIGDEWVWKENGAGDSQVEAEKGAFSDSFKRAAVLWGVGRYLYDVANTWVDLAPMGKSYRIANPKDPKLVKALELAAKGIRVYEQEPEPESSEVDKVIPLVKDFTQEELEMLLDSIEKAPTMVDLDFCKSNGRAAWKRMSETQRISVTKAIDASEALLLAAANAIEDENKLGGENVSQ